MECADVDVEAVSLSIRYRLDRAYFASFFSPEATVINLFTIL